MREIRGLGYLGVEASDPEAWDRLATSLLGLQRGDARGGAQTYRLDQYEYRLAVTPGPADDVALIGWEVADAGALASLAARLRANGVDVTDESADVARSRCATAVIAFRDPEGLRIEAFYGPSLATTNPFVPSRAIGGFVTGEQGLGHIVLFQRDIEANVRFYTELLGFRISDYIDQLTPLGMLNLTFLHCSPRHHTIAFGPPLQPRRLAHLMLQVRTIDDVGSTYYLAQQQGYRIASTLGRHTNDNMLSFYVASPSGWDVEYGCDGVEIDDGSWHVRRYDRTSVWGHIRSVPTAAADAT